MAQILVERERGTEPAENSCTGGLEGADPGHEEHGAWAVWMLAGWTSASHPAHTKPALLHSASAAEGRSKM